MKKLFSTLLISLIIGGFAFAQEADLAMPYKNFERSQSLEHLHTNTPTLEIMELGSSRGSNKDLNYNVHVRLYFENVDPQSQNTNHQITATSNAIIEEVSIDYTLTLDGLKGGIPDTETKSGTLVVNGNTDLATQVYYISNNELDDLNFDALNTVSLSINSTSNLSAYSQSTRERVAVQLFAEYQRYKPTLADLLPKFENNSNNPSLKTNEVALTWNNELEGTGKYELEWVYMPFNWSDFPPTAHFTSHSVDWSKAVRVQTKKNYYLLNTIYNEGYLVARVRTVRYQLNSEGDGLINKLEYGDWSIPSHQNSISASSPVSYTHLTLPTICSV